jgi:alpha-D-ribose 1-methylphosphonate 5-triphosphate synthase subunit PhnG
MTLSDLVQRIAEESRVELIKPPQTALLMMAAREPVQETPFYLGEVLISCCSVKVDGVAGFGAVLGEDLEQAYGLAVADAARAGQHRLAEAVAALLLREEEEERRRVRREEALVARTKVRFETMEEGPHDAA